MDTGDVSIVSLFMGHRWVLSAARKHGGYETLRHPMELSKLALPVYQTCYTIDDDECFPGSGAFY
eukprot:1146241-Pelagomonas_calceolata.AAC.3